MNTDLLWIFLFEVLIRENPWPLFQKPKARKCFRKRVGSGDPPGLQMRRTQLPWLVSEDLDWPERPSFGAVWVGLGQIMQLNMQ
jgi:hypothetical protein